MPFTASPPTRSRELTSINWTFATRPVTAAFGSQSLLFENSKKGRTIMKIKEILPITLTLGNLLALGSTTITAPDGRQFVFGDWSPAKEVLVSSTEGDVKLISRSCTVQQRTELSSTSYPVDLLYFAPGGAIWIGRGYDRYFVLGEAIYGVSTLGRGLLLSRSEQAEANGSSTETIMERALEEFVADPWKKLSPEGATHTWDLGSIFGYGALLARGDVVGAPKFAELTELNVSSDKVSYSLRSLAGHELGLTFDLDFKLLSASRDNRPVLVLFDGQSRPREWSYPSDITIPSPDGSRTAVACSGRFFSQSGTGERIREGVRAVVLQGGEVWIGPSDCRLALHTGRVFGVITDDQGQLSVFAGPRAVIPAAAPAWQTSKAFEDELGRFEQELRNGPLKAAIRLNLVELFPGKQDFSIRGISCNADGVVLRFNTSDARQLAVLTLNPQLAVASAVVAPSRP
jgi:hypothetical protein